MKTLPDLLRQEAKGISALKEKIGEKLQTTSSFPIPSGCSCYGFYLAKDELTPPFNDIDTQGINIVVHKPEQEITCYPIQHARGEKYTPSALTSADASWPCLSKRVSCMLHISPHPAMERWTEEQPFKTLLGKKEQIILYIILIAA